MSTSVRDIFEAVISLNAPPGPALSKPTELRWAEDLPGMGGKLHPMPLLPEDVDPVELPCRALFEDAHPDAGEVTGGRLAALLSEGRLCTHCLNRLNTVNLEYLTLVQRLVLPASDAADRTEGLAAELVGSPDTENINPLGLAVMARNPKTLEKLLAEAKDMEGFDQIEPLVQADIDRINAALPQVIDGLRPRSDFAEVIAAVDADLAGTDEFEKIASA